MQSPALLCSSTEPHPTVAGQGVQTQPPLLSCLLSSPRVSLNSAPLCAREAHSFGAETGSITPLPFPASLCKGTGSG